MIPIDTKAKIWYNISVDKKQIRPHCVHKGTDENTHKTNQIEIGRGLFLCNPSRVQHAFGAGNTPMVGMTVAVVVAIEEASK